MMLPWSSIGLACLLTWGALAFELLAAGGGELIAVFGVDRAQCPSRACALVVYLKGRTAA